MALQQELFPEFPTPTADEVKAAKLAQQRAIREARAAHEAEQRRRERRRAELMHKHLFFMALSETKRIKVTDDDGVVYVLELLEGVL